MSHVWILGPGRLGLNLAAVHHAAGHRVQLVGRSIGPWQDWANQLGIQCWASASAESIVSEPTPSSVDLAAAAELLQIAQLDETSTVILAVRDAQLEACSEVWAQIAQRLRVRVNQVVHVSGFHGLEVLKPWQSLAKHCIVAHPARPFAPEPDANCLQAVPTTLLGHELNTDFGALCVWGADWIHLDSTGQRAAYHAACSLAANHMTALFAEAEEIFGEQMQEDHARRLTASLALHAVQACQEFGPKAALTGPARRGDQSVIAAHLEALTPRCRALYQAQLESVLRLAEAARESS